MSRLTELRELRNAVSAEVNSLNNKYPAGQAIPAADVQKIDSLIDQIGGIDADIERTNRIAQLAADSNPNAAHEAALNAATRSSNKDSPDSAALRLFLGQGMSALSPEQRAASHARVPHDIRGAMSTTTGTEGGFTTALEYQRKVAIALKAFGGLREVATIIQTGTGTQLQLPAADYTSEIGERVGQNVISSLGETAVSLITIDTFKYGSKRIGIPFELIQDSFIDFETYITEILKTRLGRIQNQDYMVGTGTGMPRGLSAAAPVGVVGPTGQTLGVTYDSLVDLVHSVDPAYRRNPGVGFSMHDSSVKVLRKIKDLQGRPIFTPGYERNAMIDGGAPDRLLDKPIYTIQETPVMAANAKSICFGDHSAYYIRDVMDLTLFRMTDSAFTLLGQVGFVAFMRSGGNLVDVGGAVKYYQNSAT